MIVLLVSQLIPKRLFSTVFAYSTVQEVYVPL